MTGRCPLTPYPLSLLLGRIAREWQERKRLFDLPAGKFFRPGGDVDLTVQNGSLAVADGLGPAAGPHTQLAQNIVLGWLAGGRHFELKTVQILDELQIDRPCIDMETVGYNVEWSQELTLAESLREYVKAFLLLKILRRWPPLQEALGETGEHQFEVSVGYDLAGIQSSRVAEFLAGLKDATAILAELRNEVPAEFARWADFPVPGPLVRGATLSTFHGCPPEEIEAIVRHLIDRHDLDVTVKLNPTLLGAERVHQILHERLGYRELPLVPEAFREDLDLPAALQLIESLAAHARRRNRTFGIKLTNTLVVGNHKGWLPGQQMYLSGPPLHVLAVDLLAEIHRRLPGQLRLGARTEGIPVAFSAGIDRENFVRAAGLGLLPVTVCSDLLKPGGYGRLAPLLRRLEQAVAAAGCRDIPGWLRWQEGQAQQAGFQDALAAYADEVAGSGADGPYGSRTTARPPRRLPAKLEMFDCCCCNLCVTVCPNNAMLRVKTPAALQARLDKKWQYLCLAELCNACGNCTVFCPEQGEPFDVKPRMLLGRESVACEEGSAFLVRPAAGPTFEVEATGGRAAEATVVAALLNGPEGLPWWPEDLPGSLAGDTVPAVNGGSPGGDPAERDQGGPMSQIRVERDPAAERLQELNVFEWPIWTKEVSSFPWQYDGSETCYLLEGEVTVTPQDGPPVQIRKGDLVTFASGLTCRWEIHQAVRKHFTFDLE